jgi:hypothetical protein
MERFAPKTTSSLFFASDTLGTEVFWSIFSLYVKITNILVAAMERMCRPVELNINLDILILLTYDPCEL